MCGVVGCKLKRPLNDQDMRQMQSLRDALAHRGPDGAGEYIDAEAGLYLGHRRLAIIDLDERSAQPMQSERQIIAYNGEIYNYRELRKRLEGEYSFQTDSDTEVLLHAWDKWGADALLELDGMFAFALNEAQGLHLVTDFFGEKPLYVFENKNGFYFSSEAQPLIDAFQPQWKPDAQSVSQFLHLGYIEPPVTGFEGLSGLLPGTHMLIKSDHSAHSYRYWQPAKPEILSGSVQKISTQDIDELRDVLCTSLERRLRSDVPIGLFLSGGVDSALVAALAQKELGTDLKSYTVTFPDGADEAPFAENIAKDLGLTHQIIQTQSDESWRNAPQSLREIYGVPNDNMTALAVRSMCAAAKEHLSVALSGLGGDELFYGYNKYQTLYKNRAIYEHGKAFQPLLALLPFSKAQTAAALLKGDDMRKFLRVKNSISQDVLEGMDVEALKNMFASEIQGLAHKVRYFDVVSTLPQSYIPAIDRGAMRESIEVRTPFLSRALYDWVVKIDQRALIHTEKKYVLRRLLSRYMDLDLLTPTKQGFVYPISRYFKQSDTAFACDKDLYRRHERLALRQCLLAEMTSSSFAE